MNNRIKIIIKLTLELTDLFCVYNGVTGVRELFRINFGVVRFI
jgi:hypothetical protein